MKTLNQTILYTKLCKFNEWDWGNVLRFCRNKFGGGNIHRAKNPAYKSSYHNFKNWFNDGFGSGDIVVYKNMTAIVGYSVPGCTVLRAFCDLTNSIVVEDISVTANQIKKADEQLVKQFQANMVKAKIEFDEKSGELRKLYIPEKFSYIFYEYSDGRSGMGILSDFDDDVFTFLAIELDGELQRDVRIKRSDVKLKPLGRRINDFIRTLLVHDLEYSPRLHKLLSIVKRVKKGEKYWYLSDHFTVTQAIDCRSYTHNKRYSNGNYFSSYSEAVLFLMDLNELRDKHKNGEE